MMSAHIALIPARKNSKGLKNKNRYLFNTTAKFVKSLNFIDKVVVSSDDKIILNKAKKFKFISHKRKKKYSKDNTSIKKTILNISKELKLNKNHYIWLFYLPIINRKKKDFIKAFRKTKRKRFKSLCTFISTDYKFHPHYSWVINRSSIKQFIKNDNFRRQDLTKAFYHFHYICCFKLKELKYLNSELIGKNTTPIKIDSIESSKVLEIDTKSDLNKALGKIK